MDYEIVRSNNFLPSAYEKVGKVIRSFTVGCYAVVVEVGISYKPSCFHYQPLVKRGEWESTVCVSHRKLSTTPHVIRNGCCADLSNHLYPFYNMLAESEMTVVLFTHPPLFCDALTMWNSCFTAKNICF